VALVVKSPPASAGDARDAGSIPGLGRSPGGENGSGSPELQSESSYSPAMILVILIFLSLGIINYKMKIKMNYIAYIK